MLSCHLPQQASNDRKTHNETLLNCAAIRGHSCAFEGRSCEALKLFRRGHVLVPSPVCKVQVESARLLSYWGKDKWGPALLSASNQTARTSSRRLWSQTFASMTEWSSDICHRNSVVQMPTQYGTECSQIILAQCFHRKYLDNERQRIPGDFIVEGWKMEWWP